MMSGEYDLSGYLRNKQAIEQQNQADVQRYESDSAGWQQRTAMDMQVLGKDFEHPLEDDPEPPVLMAFRLICRPHSIPI